MHVSVRMCVLCLLNNTFKYYEASNTLKINE